jgi:hypothetical protein
MGVPASEVEEVIATIARVMPVGIPITITNEILEAARDRNIHYLTALLAEQDDASKREGMLVDDSPKPGWHDTALSLN